MYRWQSVRTAGFVFTTIPLCMAAVWTLNFVSLPAWSQQGNKPAKEVAKDADKDADDKLDKEDEETALAFKDVTGVWSGKWDGIWEVQFTIKPLRGKQQAFVLYEWQERPKDPKMRQGFIVQREGKTLKFGGMELIPDPEKPDAGQVIGRFVKTRTAALTRTELPEDFLKAKAALAKKVDVVEVRRPFGSFATHVATQYNCILYPEKSLTKEELDKLNFHTQVVLEPQSGVILEDALKSALKKAGLSYRIQRGDVRVGFLKPE